MHPLSFCPALLICIPCLSLPAGRFSAAQLHEARRDYELALLAAGSTLSTPAASATAGAASPLLAATVSAPLMSALVVTAAATAVTAAASAAVVDSAGLPTLPLTHLHLDHAHMGDGGDDSWSPSVHLEYLVPPAVYSFSLTLCPC